MYVRNKIQEKYMKKTTFSFSNTTAEETNKCTLSINHAYCAKEAGARPQLEIHPWRQFVQIFVKSICQKWDSNPRPHKRTRNLQQYL